MYLTSLIIYIHPEMVCRTRSLLSKHSVLHIHTVSHIHTWELPNTITAFDSCLQSNSTGDIGGQEPLSGSCWGSGEQSITHSLSYPSFPSWSRDFLACVGYSCNPSHSPSTYLCNCESKSWNVLWPWPGILNTIFHCPWSYYYWSFLGYETKVRVSKLFWIKCQETNYNSRSRPQTKSNQNGHRWFRNLTDCV